MQLQPLGVDHSVSQIYYGLPEAKKGFTCHMDPDSGKGRGSGDKALIPSNKGGSIVPAKSGNSGLAPSNPSNPLVYNPMGVPTLPEPRKPLGLRQLIDKAQASVPLTNPGPSSSTNAIGPVTNPGPSSSINASGPVTEPKPSGQNSPVMLPGSTGQLPAGRYEGTPAGWVRVVGPVDSQDLPEVPTRFHSTTTVKMKENELLALYPHHRPGQGNGFGHCGGNNSHTLTRLLRDKNPYAIQDFVNNSNIPPNKHEAMITYATTFWVNVWRMYEGVGVDMTTSEWPVWHREPLATTKHTDCNDTLISIKTIDGGSREELKVICIQIMDTMREQLMNPENWPEVEDGIGVEYWKFFHEYMAARHYYQVFLLDDNTL